MISVVLDTNIVVSALLSPKGSEAAVFRLCLSGIIHIYVSEPILQEYEGVLSRPKFKRSLSVVHQLMAGIRQASELVVPARSLSVSTDRSDNRFLECAEAAKAEFLVTGNRRHVPAEWKGTKIVGAPQLLALLVPKP